MCAKQPAKKAAPVDGVPHDEVAQAKEIEDLNKARRSTHEMAEQSKAPPPQPLQQPRAQAPHAVGMATLHDAFGWELGAINGAS